MGSVGHVETCTKVAGVSQVTWFNKDSDRRLQLSDSKKKACAKEIPDRRQITRAGCQGRIQVMCQKNKLSRNDLGVAPQLNTRCWCTAKF